MKKNIIKYLLFMPLAAMTASCANYLDQDPEDFNSLDKVFASEVQTREWYNRIYSNDFMIENIYYSDEVHYFWWSDESACTQAGWISNIGKGLVGPDTNYGYTIYEQNFYYFQRYYKAIRHCNILLENIDKCTGLSDTDKRTFIAETRFMRAYYHNELFRLYGPIPIVESSRTTSQAVSPQARNTTRQCVDWIIAEMDWACQNGLADTRGTNEKGMPTTGAAKALVSRMLLMVASPLYNGNPAYRNWTNNNGTPLMPQTYDPERWKDAADAAKYVIDNYSYSLHRTSSTDFDDIVDNYREITTTWNDELIWAWPNSSYWYVMRALPARWYGWKGRFSLALGQVNSYFMADGTEAPSLESWFSNVTYTGDAADSFSDAAGDGTIAGTFNMFVGREPRFYASIHFPNQRISYAYPGSNNPNMDGEGYGIVDFWYTGLSGQSHTPGDKNTSGFSPRKNLSLDVQSATSPDRINYPNIPFPIIRLGEIYLNYAEALNEYDPGNADIIIYLNEIRTRAGLPAYGGSYSQDEMRDMIHAERRVELAWECNRFFDVRRWFKAHGPEGLFNHDEYGMNMTAGNGPTDPAFFTMTKVADKTFNIEHYFMPIKSSEVALNTSLVQAPFY